MTDSLHVRLWIDGALVVDKDVDLLTASLLGTEHAHRAVEAAHAGKPYLLEISDPDRTCWSIPETRMIGRIGPKVSVRTRRMSCRTRSITVGS